MIRPVLAMSALAALAACETTTAGMSDPAPNSAIAVEEEIIEPTDGFENEIEAN